MTLVSDAHAHLETSHYPEDLEAVIDRARAAGLRWIINVALLTEGEEVALAVARRHDFIQAMVGLHPHDAAEWSPGLAGRLEGLAQGPKVVGLGEMGLDFFRDYAPREAQEKAFADQLDLARKLRLPVAIHDREAHQRTLEIVKAHGRGLTGLFHCFSGSVDLARQVLDLGFHVSIPGVITFAKARVIKEVAAYVPLDRLLVETDCPYLAPEPHRGKRNEPALVVETARALARARGLAYEELAQATTANLEGLFGLGKRR